MLMVGFITAVVLPPVLLAVDINNDGVVNTLDLNIYKLAHRTTCGDPAYNSFADFNKDCEVNAIDLNILRKAYRLPAPTIPNIRDRTPGWTFGIPIDRVGWTVQVSDEHDVEDRYGILDGVPEYIWRSGSASATNPTSSFPHTVVVDMQAQHWVDGLVYVPRPYDASVSWSENGNIAQYEVWVSDNYTPEHIDETGETVAANGIWGRVASGTLTYDTPGQTQTIEFLIPNNVRWVKLVALSDVKGTNIAAAGEIYITESLPDVQ